ncbi:phosphoribosylanthranilate isomerase [Yinghuangia seranimata]|uniref:phosphoribosylanthranilate isomerase n=1 Tax=Yinghuangia seranimata TaxID=408067 RepID=UPI00248C8113|nr:phosphoribosylanthranilate isomerase [Yinghuangia seranimata]MDI2127052.1 phosphoribosylanthranilate isomerase [Yinghuangia seranimata]
MDHRDGNAGVFVKVCGLGSRGDVDAAAAAGADAVGFVLSRTSVRALAPEKARELVAHVPPTVLSVLVVHDMGAVEGARAAEDLGVDVLQLHGRRYAEQDFRDAAAHFPRLWRATSLSERPDLRVGAYGEESLLLDSPRAGSGTRWDLSLLTDTPPRGRWLLAGGLDATNVADAIHQAHPWGVDVSSGVESAPGVKDHTQITRFVEAARKAV